MKNLKFVSSNFNKICGFYKMNKYFQSNLIKNSFINNYYLSVIHPFTIVNPFDNNNIQIDDIIDKKINNIKENLNSELILNNEDLDNCEISVDLKGRNSKAPKRANHGARPCSSVMRRLKSRAYYRTISIKK